MLFKKGELKHLKLFYIFELLDPMLAVVWIYWIIYMLDRGFSMGTIGLAMAIMSLSQFVLEVPTGAVADVFGRKASVLLGAMSFCLVMLIMPSIDSPVMLCVIFAIWALPITLMSGAMDAWVVDLLKAEGREDLIKEFYAKWMSLANLGFICASITGGLIVKYFDMDLLWYIEGTWGLMTLLVIVFQKEHFTRKKFDLKGCVKQSVVNIVEGAKFAASRRDVGLVLLAGAFWFAGIQISFVCIRPLMDNIGIPREYFGYLSALSAALCVAIPFVAKHVAAKVGCDSAYLAVVCFAFSMVVLGLFFTTSTIIVAVIAVVMQTRTSFYESVQRPYFQEFLPSPIRATMGSFKAMVGAVALMVADLMNALFADAIGMQSMMGIAALVMLPAALLYLRVGKRKTEPVPSVEAAKEMQQA